jgi:hypothetical protein
MAPFNKAKPIRHKGPFTIAGHGVGVGITVIAILVIIAMVFNLQEGNLSE